MDEKLYEERYVGTWWNDHEIPLWRIEGEVYALYGWNGEEYRHCWKVSGESLTEASEEEYIIRPLYNKDDEIIDYTIV